MKVIIKYKKEWPYDNEINIINVKTNEDKKREKEFSKYKNNAKEKQDKNKEGEEQKELESNNVIITLNSTTDKKE